MRAVGEADALLIGNQGYSTKIGALKNPHADIALVGAALRSLDFKVTEIRTRTTKPSTPQSSATSKPFAGARGNQVVLNRWRNTRPSCFDGEALFEHRNKFGFEGVVSKHLASRYSSGPSRNPGLEAHQFGAT